MVAGGGDIGQGVAVADQGDVRDAFSKGCKRAARPPGLVSLFESLELAVGGQSAENDLARVAGVDDHVARGLEKVAQAPGS
jgi:hypothetical protein